MVGQINRGSLLGEHIFRLSKNPEIKVIVEIGTWNGMGSTKCIYDGIIQGLKKEHLVLSIECNLTRHKEALTNLISLRNFNLIHGTIVSIDEMEAIKGKFNLTTTSQPWWAEDVTQIKSAPYILDQIPEKIDLLILDGGEFTSHLEFEKLWNRTRFIVLDDTDNTKSVKSYESREFILSHPDNFKIIEDNLQDRNGFLVCENITKA